jgi:hypothetical protein
MSRQDIVKLASNHIGTVEGVNNTTQYGQWYGMDHVAWCAIFVSYVYNYADEPLPAINSDEGFHYVPTIFAWAKKNKKITTEPLEGDIVIFDWNGDGRHDHTGIFVEWVDKNWFISIEGNTASDDKGNQSNGGGVYRKKRNKKFATFINVID